MNDLIKAFELKKDDFILLTGNFSSYLLRQKKLDKNYSPNAFIDEIIGILGTNGTLALQTFSWDFCQGLTYDIKNTKSKTGALGNAALKRADFIRTKHPIYSFAVWGKVANELKKLENSSSFGENSPFEYFHKYGAKMIIANLELDHSFTFVHYAEQKCKIDYRYEKNFTGFYIDENGVKSERIYSMFVRDLKRDVRTDLSGLHKLFLKENAMKINICGNDEIKIIKLKKAYEIIENDIKNNYAKNLHKILKP